MSLRRHEAFAKTDSLQPKGEDLRRAVRWIAEHRDHSPRAVEEAARRFDLSPADEEFLLRHFADCKTDAD